MGGERVPAHDDEVAEHPCGERDERPADERVAHEGRLEDVAPVGLVARIGEGHRHGSFIRSG